MYKHRQCLILIVKKSHLYVQLYKTYDMRNIFLKM